MLFNVRITNEDARDPDNLCSLLYKFLDLYIPLRLVYEDKDEIANCKQDTILHLLQRYNELDDDKKDTINLEKFFYNRSHSFVSAYIRKLKTRRKYERQFTSLAQENISEHIRNYSNPVCLFDIDMEILLPLIERYNLDSKTRKLVEERFNEFLEDFYSNLLSNDEMLIKEVPKENITYLAFSILDDYIIELNKKEKKNKD